MYGPIRSLNSVSRSSSIPQYNPNQKELIDYLISIYFRLNISMRSIPLVDALYNSCQLKHIYYLDIYIRGVCKLIWFRFRHQIPCFIHSSGYILWTFLIKHLHYTINILQLIKAIISFLNLLYLFPYLCLHTRKFSHHRNL